MFFFFFLGSRYCFHCRGDVGEISFQMNNREREEEEREGKEGGREERGER